MTTMPSLPPLNWDAIRQVSGLLLMLTSLIGAGIGLWVINPWLFLVAGSAFVGYGGYLLATTSEET